MDDQRNCLQPTRDDDRGLPFNRRRRKGVPIAKVRADLFLCYFPVKCPSTQLVLFKLHQVKNLFISSQFLDWTRPLSLILYNCSFD